MFYLCMLIRCHWKSFRFQNIFKEELLGEVPNNAQKMKFSIKDFFSKCDQITFTEEILNGKLYFLCNENPAKPSGVIKKNVKVKLRN